VKVKERGDGRRGTSPSFQASDKTMPIPTEPTGATRRFGHFSFKGIGLAALLAMPLALGGCAWLGFGGEEEIEPVESGPKPCPAIGVLDGADRVTVFNGRGMDLTDVVIRGEIRKAVTECEYDKGSAEIVVDIAFDGQAALGPAASSREMSLKGFATVVRHGAIKNKQVFEIPVSFSGAARTVRFLKTIEDTKIPYGGTLDGSAYEILVGFQLTPEQFEYNNKVPAAPLR